MKIKNLTKIIAEVLIILLFISFPGYSGGGKNIIEKIQKKYESIIDYKAKFKQTVEYVALGKSQSNTGIVYFKKPGRMRWEYSPPKSQLIIMNTEKIWFYIPDEKQVMVEEVKKAFSSKTPLNLLSGAANLSKYFNAKKSSRFKEKAHGMILKLFPKEKIQEVKALYIAVDEKSYIITDTFLIDKFENITHVELTDIQTNLKLPEDLFRFKVPSGVQVVKPSEVMKKHK